MIKPSVHIVFLLLLAFQAVGQKNKKHDALDSLNAVWNNSTIELIERVKAGQEIARAYKNVNPDTAIVILKQLVDLADDNKDPIHIQTYMLMAGTYRTQGNYPLALDAAQDALTLAEELEDQTGIASAYNSMGQIMERQEDFEKALEYHTKSLIITKKLGDHQKIGMAYSNLGNIYGQLFMLQKSLDTYEQALKHLKEVDDQHGISVVNGNMGYVYSIQGDSVIENGGNAYVAGSYYLQSIQRSRKAMEYFESIGNRNFVLNAKSNIGLVYNSMSEFQQAKMICYEAYLESIEQNIYPMERDACGCLYDSYKGLKMTDSALIYYERFVHLKDSLLDMNEQRNFLEKELSYNYERQAQLADELHKQELDNQQIQAAKDKYIRNITIAFVSIGLLGFLIFSIFLYNRFKIIRAQKDLIEKQKDDLRLQKELVDYKNAEITDSIIYARRFQNAILPSEKKFKQILPDSFIFYRPKDIVAGDFYWLFKENDQIIFAVADCTGHGVPGAMVSVVCHNALNRSVREYGLRDPGKILDKTREIILEELNKNEEEVKDGMDIALVSLELGASAESENETPHSHSASHSVLKFAGAHNPLWIIRKDSAEVEEVKANKQPIGQFDSPIPFDSHSIEISKGDQIYIFSDGYADQFGGEKGKKFKSSNLKRLLLSNKQANMSTQFKTVESTFDDWMGSLEQVDDVCIIGVRF
ncbi:MAG: tetratricopeptide repeat protein [Crocinitomicaceae bacterium]|nr:tetratricopeptide repeat protein [Crocinitomicaceae bacterium]